jgi:hypothetical protein
MKRPVPTFVLVLSPAPVGTHQDDLGIKRCHDIDEFPLRGHDPANVLVHTRNLIKTSSQ